MGETPNPALLERAVRDLVLAIERRKEEGRHAA